MQLVLGLVFNLSWLYLASKYDWILLRGSVYLIYGALFAGFIILVVGAFKDIGENFYLIFAAITLIIIILILNFRLKKFWKNLPTAIAMLDTCADFLLNNKRIFLVSSFGFVAAILFTMAFSKLLVGILAINNIQVNEEPEQFQNKRILFTPVTSVSVWALILSFFWAIDLIYTFVQFVVMIVVAQNYFTSSN